MAKIRFTKDNRLFYITYGNLTPFAIKQCCAIRAVELKTNKVIGVLRFDFIYDEGYLQSINIEDKSYLNCGVGTTMLRAAESYFRHHNVTKITGYYSPFGDGKEITPYFYKKNGYQISAIKNLSKDLTK